MTLARRTSSSLLLLSGSLLLLTHCADPEIGTGGPASPSQDPAPGDGPVVTRTATLLPDTDYTRDLKLYDDVRAIDHATAATFIKSDDRIVFNARNDANYATGDVLVSDYDDGLFRVITGVSTSATSTTLFTRPAKLEDAIAEGEIYMAKLAQDGIAPPESFSEAPSFDTSSNGLLVARQGLSFSKDLGWKGSLYSYDRDFAPELTSAINDEHVEFTAAHLTAEIGAEVYTRLTARLAWPPVELEEGRISSNGKVVGDLRVKLQSDDAFSYDKSITLIGPQSAGALVVAEPVSHTLLPNLFPLKFTFEVASQLDVSASVEGHIEAELGYKVVAGAAAGVEKKDGEWRFVQTNNLVPERFGPVFRGEKNARADAKLTTSLTLTIGERANGFATLSPALADAHFSQQINADTGACPTAFNVRVKGTFRGQLASIDIPLLGEQTIMSDAIDKTLYDRTLIDYQEQLELPGVCDPNYMPPTHQGDLLPGEKCMSTDSCVTGVECFKETCVTRGEFRVSAAWYEATDGDIIVETPSGSQVKYGGKSAGGHFDFLGSCSRECSQPGPYVESIYFDQSAEDGTYKVWVRNYDGKSGSKLDIEIKQGEEGLRFEGELPATARESSQVFEFEVSGGKIVGGMSL